jgi:hypothetical protein
MEMKKALAVLALGTLGAIGFAVPALANGHDPVTICHKPDGPDITITVDDSAVAAHLAHGDSLGPCEGETTTTTTVDDPPETTTTSTPSGPRCPPGMVPWQGKDGEPGNDECCFDVNANQVCDTKEAAITSMLREVRAWRLLVR